jgi:hypothetical protein
VTASEKNRGNPGRNPGQRPLTIGKCSEIVLQGAPFHLSSRVPTVRVMLMMGSGT